ncbi:MAG TPA: lactate racemase domain-containing protein [Planctomycetota bacterium]|nr:lactate racemase domain-containing protein [Planctomycetota bacterium]
MSPTSSHRTTVRLKYGAGFEVLEVPAANLRGVHGLASGARGDDSDARLAAGVGELERSGFGAAVAGKRLTLLVDDATRSEPRAPVLAALSPLLGRAARVRVVVCTGTHEPDLPENVKLADELRALVAGLPKAEVLVHDSRKPELHRSAGRTSRGVDVLVDVAADECDLFLAISDMKTHYFAGYSNPVKNFVPGICAFETARGNHAMALRDEATFGRHPFHPDPSRRDNPLSADMVEGMEKILGGRTAWSLAMFTIGGRVRWCSGGPLPDVASRGMVFVDRETTLELEPVDRLIVSAGGHPYDESLYTAQRALELTKNAVKPGGEILFLARCANGIGPPEAHHTFFGALAKPLPDVLHSIGSRYEMYSHKAFKFAAMLLALRAVRVHTDLTDDALRAAHLEPAPDPQAVVDRWVSEDPSASIQAIDDASKLAVLARAGASA